MRSVMPSLNVKVLSCNSRLVDDDLPEAEEQLTMPPV
jgi:hypothetical protein